MKFSLGQRVQSNNDKTAGEVVAIGRDESELTLVQVKWDYNGITWFRAYRLDPQP